MQSSVRLCLIVGVTCSNGGNSNGKLDLRDRGFSCDGVTCRCCEVSGPHHTTPPHLIPPHPTPQHSTAQRKGIDDPKVRLHSGNRASCTMHYAFPYNAHYQHLCLRHRRKIRSW
ncbi:uncharacterized protein LOC123519341 isoform X2 [Portunus trituberculatus]|uniref:uncharacterized protein LOC123519341 isoform X2 n=1 Tax=Portunus trituberculatus TaxID=210409 RepID=UPI001E1CB5D6|nr:uncharacterized protein LOC123519341 isoform X2 [Portunus trituberculatus]